MPLQETYLEKPVNGGRALVIKSYDEKLAREAFESIGDDTLESIATALKLHDLFEEEDIPNAQSPEYRDFLWETLSDEAREDGHTKSFFIVVKEITGQLPAALYVSPDWPSAELFAQGLSQE
ncbi:hypothetical protein [Tunturiibacter gelidoferens]|uniref:Uncharacterized protein n=1 Tax=Tunturiibacter lichenicola TaxID=2051959 RepID=A0A7Y9NKI4_9BACT|nr:hypothetical protein [Edaphobacter lichenicola]NYF51070.1 hypothetical protein [Edaphobacter lichenicola]